jgi:hypothetical protein
MIDDLSTFIEERNKMLLSLDPAKAIAFYKKYNPGQKPPEGEILEISLHKARTGALTLPIEARRESKKWLTDHGFSSMDDDNL